MARSKQTNRKLAQQIGVEIRAYRQANDMTQAQLAEAVGLETETISRMENGTRLPTIEKLLEMANVFRTPIASFFVSVDSAALTSASDLYAQKISAAIDGMPEKGKNFVLSVAQDYARYHFVTKKRRSAK